MNPQIYLDVLIGVAVIALIGYRQLAWSRVKPRKLMALPIILAGYGLYNLVTAGPRTLTVLDGWFMLAQTATAVAVGLIMGRVTKFKTESGSTASRSGMIGAGLWIAFIGVRLGLDALAHTSGAEMAASTGVILLTVAVNRFTQNALVLARYRHNRTGTAPQPLAGVR